MFTRKVYTEIVEDSLNFCVDKKGLLIYGYIFMTNHIPLPLQAKDNNRAVLRDFKKFTSQRITKAIEENN